jgi:osmotically-inducible protein OsmY
MPNRQQNYQSGRDWDRDYGQYANDDEGRYAGYGNFGQGDYNQPRGSGQGGSGQGGYGQGDYGQPNYSYGQPGYGRGGSEYSRTGSSSGVGYRGEGWREPYGEGQQYGSGGSSQGQHRGKGPKNYQRSDERVKEMLCERLHDDPEIDASDVSVSVQGGRIMLEGTVDSRRTKNAIEDVAEQLGSLDVQNNLRVQKGGERSAMETSGRSSMSTKPSTAGEESEQSRQKRN